MKIKHKKYLKYSEDLEVADEIKVGDLYCVITKVEDVFHHTPKSRVCLTLSICGATPKKSEAILFLPARMPIVTLK